MDDLQWLEQWLASQADGTWEHHYGVKLESCDNPGWWLTIDLKGIAVADGVIKKTGVPETAKTPGGTDWMVCEIKDGKFSGAGDPGKLRAILRCFREWATAHTDRPGG